MRAVFLYPQGGETMKLTIKEYFKKNVEVNGEIKKLVREELAIDTTSDLPTADYKEGEAYMMTDIALVRTSLSRKRP